MIYNLNRYCEKQIRDFQVLSRECWKSSIFIPVFEYTRGDKWQKFTFSEYWHKDLEIQTLLVTRTLDFF